LSAEKRVEVHGPGETTYITLAYRAPAASEPDFFVTSVLDSLFTGPSSLNMFGGGGISNKTSRLYRALVEKELAISVNGGLQATIDPYLYSITITARPEVSAERIISAVDEEISRLQQSKVTREEIDRAVKQARACLLMAAKTSPTRHSGWATQKCSIPTGGSVNMCRGCKLSLLNSCRMRHKRFFAAQAGLWESTSRKDLNHEHILRYPSQFPARSTGYPPQGVFQWHHHPYPENFQSPSVVISGLLGAGSLFDTA